MRAIYGTLILLMFLINFSLAQNELQVNYQNGMNKYDRRAADKVIEEICTDPLYNAPWRGPCCQPPPINCSEATDRFGNEFFASLKREIGGTWIYVLSKIDRNCKSSISTNF